MSRGVDPVSAFVPTDDVVSAVLCGSSSHGDGDQERLRRIKDNLEEDVKMVDLFLERLRTPSFLLWVERDSVLLRDVVRAAHHLKRAMVIRVCVMSGSAANA